MAQVIRQQPKRDEFGNLLTLGGAVIGGVATGGSPGGILTGAQIGGLAGGLAGQEQAQAQTNDSASQAQAMQRKLQASTQDNLAILKQAEAHLPKLPEHLRQQYSLPIIQARMEAERQRGDV